MTHSLQYRDGQRNAIKWAVAWLHLRAENMNDPQAKAILDSAAFHLGVDAKNGRLFGVETESQ